MTLRSLLLAALASTTLATAQTGRTMTQVGPALLGNSFGISIAHPTTAGGNYYEALASTPTAAAVDLGLAEVQGLLRVDAASFFTLYSGTLSPTGTTTQSLPVPNNRALVGARFDVQSVDVDLAGPTFFLADDDITPLVLSICQVEIAQATSSGSVNTGNDLLVVTDATIGAPVSHGLPSFAWGIVRHRGNQGFVEGYGGTFSVTSHNSDIDSVSARRVARRTANPAYQVIACPNGYDISVIRSSTNLKQFSILSYERATGIARIVPGTTFVDGNPTTPAPNSQIYGFYPAISRDGVWCACQISDSTPTAPPPDRFIVFRTDGRSPAIDITAAAPVSTDYFDGAHFYTDDFLIVAGSGGYYWTSATNPTTLQPLTMPNTTASNAPNVFVYPFSWRVADDGDTAYVAIGSDTLAARGEMDLVKLTDNAGAPQVVNYSQFAAPTGLCEFGYSAITPATTNNSSTGIKCSVSPNGQKVALLAATTTATGFPGLYVIDGTANPPLHTVAGATFYSEVAFVNATTVLFFAGPSDAAQGFYELDVPTGTITQIGTALDHKTRGQFWSLNGNWWYFVRSNAAGTVNNIVGFDTVTGNVKDITGNEFASGTRPAIRTGSFNTTTDPWFALEMQLRRAPVGNRAYFTARRETGIVGVFEDANVFGFDIETGGVATALTNYTGQGAASAIRNIESLTISADGNHLAWAARLGNAAATSEDVFHLDVATTTIRQASVSTPTGQTVTDGSILFTCNPPTGLTWSIGTGTTNLPITNARIEWAPLDGGTPILLTTPPTGTRLLQVIGTH